MNCPFCNNPDIKERIIYKDDLVMAFPTNLPITPGHVLICPTRHIANVDDLTDNELLAIKNLILKLKNSLSKAVSAQGFNIAWNEGISAGQSIDHLHIHIVPRKEGDSGIYKYEPREFLYRPGSRSESPESELQDIAKLVRENLN
jgi:diadenosine tetraphosphate (Ap4A) HIT family hydrolase